MSKPAEAVSGQYDRREQIGWYFYDWANSVFYTSVVTVFLGPYLTEVARTAADADGFIYPLGIRILADSFYPYLVSLAVGFQIFFLPIFGACADYTSHKKTLLGITAFIGAFATMGLYFLYGTNYMLGGGLFLLANFAFGASIVIYNGFLPEIAAPDDRDRVSSQAWALGYLGGGLLLALNLVFVQFLAEPLGVSLGHAVRISLASAGIWWAVFTLVPLATIKRRPALKSLPPNAHILTVGFKQLRQTLRKLPSTPHTLLFLLAYLFYNDGIHTVIALAAQFGSQELGMETPSLMMVILMVQFVAFFGALLFDYVARAIGAKRAIISSLFIWTAVIIYAFGFLETETQFFVMGGVIAIVLGGSQALSRSLFSQMIPEGQEAEFFSLYEVSDRGTSWLGPLLFGLTLQFTGSYRWAILSVMFFFIVGLVLLFWVNVRRAIEEAGNEIPKKI